MMRSLLIGSLLFAVCWPDAPAWSRTPSGSKSRVKTRVLKSRWGVKKVLGKHIARQLPAKFDFRRYALVWVDLPVNKKSKLRIVTVPASRALYLSHSSALRITVKRTTHRLSFVLTSGSPCSGGARKRRSAMVACSRAVVASMKKAKTTLLLFATPRSRLRRASAKRQRAMPRP